MGKPDEFDPRLKAYLHRGAGTPPPARMDARIIGATPRRKTGWVLQVVAAAAVLVLAVGLGIVIQRARQSVGVTPTATPFASPITKPTPYPTPTTSGAPYPLLPPVSLRMINASTGWAAGSGTDRILRTVDGGSHWDDAGPRGAPPANWTTFFFDGNNAWVASSLQPSSDSTDYSVHVYRTTDGGQSWHSAGEVGADQGWPASMQFVDAKHGWLHMNVGSLYGTTDGGTTWAKVSEADTSGSPGYLPLGCGKTAPVFLNSSTGWIPGGCNGGGGLYLYASRDAGATWNAVTISMPAGYSGSCRCGMSGMRFSDSRNGLFVLDIYGADGATHSFIYATHDAGASWLPGPMLPANCFSVDFLTAAVGWTLNAKGNIILYTGDGGQHWSTRGTIPSSQGVMDFEFVNSAIGWAVGSEPAGNTLIKTSDGGRTWTTQLTP